MERRGKAAVVHRLEVRKRFLDEYKKTPPLPSDKNKAAGHRKGRRFHIERISDYKQNIHIERARHSPRHSAPESKRGIG